MKPFIKLAITSGDADGIGPEVVSKALSRIKAKKNVLFYLWRGPSFPKKYLKLIDSQYSRIEVNSWPEAFQQQPSSGKYLIDINSTQSPVQWVELMAKTCRNKHLDGLITAPLSKTLIAQQGLSDIGHTEILSRITRTPNVFMTFIGEKFNVLSVTGHIPLDSVTSALTKKKLLTAIEIANNYKNTLSKRTSQLPLALLGVNPHAGESGIISSKEESIFIPVIEEARKKKILIEGPLVPDAAFLEKNWKKYAFYICPYHDQGLIPFKLVHQHNGGVHVTAGLPFVRTSVEHGTAKDIFGKNKADPSSMIDAIKWAVKLNH